MSTTGFETKASTQTRLPVTFDGRKVMINPDLNKAFLLKADDNNGVDKSRAFEDAHRQDFNGDDGLGYQIRISDQGGQRTLCVDRGDHATRGDADTLGLSLTYDKYSGEVSGASFRGHDVTDRPGYMAAVADTLVNIGIQAYGHGIIQDFAAQKDHYHACIQNRQQTAHAPPLPAADFTQKQGL